MRNSCVKATSTLSARMLVRMHHVLCDLMTLKQICRNQSHRAEDLSLPLNYRASLSGWVVMELVLTIVTLDLIMVKKELWRFLFFVSFSEVNRAPLNK